jgi:hypothetical protein
MSPLKHSRNIAARMGRWSASHWKTATFGWLAFVIASFAIGIAVPVKMIEQRDAAVGEAGKANRIVDESFDHEDRRRSRLPCDDRRHDHGALGLRAGRERPVSACRG